MRKSALFSKWSGAAVAAILCAAALLVALSASPAIPAARAALRFAWISDTHVGSDRGADDLRATVADINAQPGLSFVLVTGDITEMGSLAESSLAKEILDALRIPCHVIPGNHDTKWSESGGSDFRRLWGADRFAFESGGFRFIGLSQGPVMRMGDGHWAPQDVRWLEGVLDGKGAGVKPIVFVTHYPIDESIANWFVVLDKLKTVPTVAVLVGHGHRNKAMDFEGLAGLMGRSNLGTDATAPGYTIVEIGAKAMTFAERTAGRTLPPWHRLELERDGLPVVKRGKAARASGAKPGPPARPDFGVNAQYPQVRVRWRFDAGWTIASSAAVSGRTVVFGDASGAVRALRVADGSIAWEFKTGEPVYSTPEAAGDRVIFGGTDGKIYALDARTGTPVWRIQTGGPIVASPRAADGVVYIGSGDHVFRAVEPVTGRRIWSYDGVEGFVETKPAVADGKVVFGAWDGRLYALDVRTGGLAWTWQGEKPSRFYSPAACWPVAAGGRAYIVTPGPWMAAIDLATGSELWGTDNWAVRESIGISEDGRRVYVRTSDDIIAAFSTEADDFEPLWETSVGSGHDINSAMLVEKDGVVFYGTKNGLLLALNAETGSVKWKHRVGVALLNTVTPISGREVVVTDFDGRVSLVASDR
jgi:outer membrane protein assembly factor BamB